MGLVQEMAVREQVVNEAALYTFPIQTPPFLWEDNGVVCEYVRV